MDIGVCPVFVWLGGYLLNVLDAVFKNVGVLWLFLSRLFASLPLSLVLYHQLHMYCADTKRGVLEHACL